MVTGALIIIKNFFPLVCEMLLSIFDLGQHFMNFGQKFSMMTEASQYCIYV